MDSITKDYQGIAVAPTGANTATPTLIAPGMPRTTLLAVTLRVTDYHGTARANQGHVCG